MRRTLLPAFKDARRRLILALESSADDTCAAVVSSHREILSNVVLKQNNIHEQYGGIHPLYAVQGHMMNIPQAINDALRLSNLSLNDMDAIATTQGPGMPGCLQIAIVAAKALAGVSNKPLIGVHHMQAHALTCTLTEKTPPEFPFYTLLCSGGHTMIVDSESVHKMSILATSHDDSIGNAFDQAAKLLNIPWSLHPSNAPGAALEVFADQENIKANEVALIKEYRKKLRVPAPGQLLFSYSGLRSAFGRLVEESDKTEMTRKALARAFQAAAVAQLKDKIELALDNAPSKPSSLVVSGGVASNGYLRKSLTELIERQNMSIYFPAPSLCTDNAAMIAWAAHYKLANEDFSNPCTLMSRPKWSLEEL
ncbi:peptidase M22, glycoprotease [Wallemia mellicola]|nr:peptidase M22, glycoprotease [Wallemia mellicola]TIB86546.1 peptidase M22, glycoprotease [Wallemia mellicola]TIC35115.1 peptidase M22, glycoprotease [Wallemia mellicola]TIC39629.1 peptidase M22, glycoprotease [Wallemia mellicola]TIC47932.1 peptidase M22, glycoprotease [Wallemia mellicola]